MAEQLTLGELIAALSSADQDLIVPAGFDNPHSYRGVYAELAFEPAGDVTVAAMLADAHDADGAMYEGWKGGWFTMTRDTLCHIAYEGYCGDEDGLTRELLDKMLAAGRRPVAGSVVDRVESLIASTMDEVESIGGTAPGPLSDDRLIEQLEAESAAQSLLRDELDEARAEIGRLRGQLGMHLTAWRNARSRARIWRLVWGEVAAARNRLERELAQVLKNYEILQGRALVMEGERDEARAERDRLAEENDRLRADVEAAKRGWRKDVATVERVRGWVNGDVVTARSEFGNGYREAMRDVRDLLAARDAKEETRG